MKPPKPGRLPCCVPYCGRTMSLEKYPGTREMICGKHWKMLGRRVKFLYRAILRRVKRNPKAWNDLDALFDRNWQRAKKQAIERSMGI